MPSGPTYAVGVARWRVIGAVLVTLGAATVILGSAMPWLRTGRRRRTSFEVFGMVDRLGFSPSGTVGWAVRLWPIVPLLVILAAVLAWFDVRWSLPVAVVAVVYAGGVGVAVSGVDDRSFVGIEAGPVVTATGAALILLGAGSKAVATLRGHAHRRRRESDPDCAEVHVPDR